MKLKEFIVNLNELIKENPLALEYEVIYSSDDEGDDYRIAYYPPTICEANLEGLFIDNINCGQGVPYNPNAVSFTLNLSRDNFKVLSKLLAEMVTYL